MYWKILGLDPQQGKRYFFLPNVETVSEPRLAIYYLVNGSSEVTNKWRYSSTLLIRLHGMNRNKVYFLSKFLFCMTVFNT